MANISVGLILSKLENLNLDKLIKNNKTQLDIDKDLELLDTLLTNADNKKELIKPILQYLRATNFLEETSDIIKHWLFKEFNFKDFDELEIINNLFDILVHVSYYKLKDRILLENSKKYFIFTIENKFKNNKELADKTKKWFLNNLEYNIKDKVEIDFNQLNKFLT